MAQGAVVAVSQDGQRVLFSVPDGRLLDRMDYGILDSNGKLLWQHVGPISDDDATGGSVGAGSSDLRSMIVGTPLGGYPLLEASSEVSSGAIVVSIDGNSGNQTGIVNLGNWTSINSLSMSSDGNLVAVSGPMGDTYTFISAYDSAGHQLWTRLSPTHEINSTYHILAYEGDRVAVSGDGGFVAVARADTATFMDVFLCCYTGTNSGVLLFSRDGRLLWNYTTKDPVYDVTLSDDAELVVAMTTSEILGLSREGRLLWTVPLTVGTLVLSNNGERFVAFDVNGGLVLGYYNGSFVQFNNLKIGGWPSVSNDGRVVAVALLLEPSLDFRLLAFDEQNQLLLNYTLRNANGTATDKVAGDGCCIVASTGSGFYYFERNPNVTQTASTSSNTVLSPAIPGFQPESILLGILISLVMVALVRRKRRIHNPNSSTKELGG